MIVRNLNSNIYSFSDRIIGIKKRNFSDDDLQIIIEADLQNNFDEVIYSNVMIISQDIDDARTNFKCGLYKVEILVSFNETPSSQTLEIIKIYVKDLLIEDLE